MTVMAALDGGRQAGPAGGMRWRAVRRDLGWHILAFASLLVISRAPFFLIGGSGDAAQAAYEGSGMIQASLVGIYLILLGSLAWSHRLGSLVAALRREWLMLAVVGVAAASLLWSAAPEVTIRRVVALAGLVLVAAGIGTRLGPAGSLRAVCFFYGALSLGSLVLWVVAPDTVVMGDDRLLSGPLGHKNDFGRACSQAAVAFSALLLFATTRSLLLWTGWACCLLALVGSFSKTGLGALALSVSVGWLLVMLLNRRRRRDDPDIRQPPLLKLPFMPLVTGIVFVALLAGGLAATAAANVDTTLTGRTVIWEKAVAIAMKKALLGHGFGAFWLGDYGPSADLHEQLGWTVLHSHNAALDLFLDLGLLGVTGVAIWLFLTGRDLWRRLRSPQAQAAEAAVALMWIHLFILAMTGSAWFSHMHITWGAFLVCWFGIRSRPPGAPRA